MIENSPTTLGEASLILSLGQEDCLEKEMSNPLQLFLPRKSPWAEELVDCSPWGCRRVGYYLRTIQQEITPRHVRAAKVMGSSSLGSTTPYHLCNGNGITQLLDTLSFLPCKMAMVFLHTNKNQSGRLERKMMLSEC